MTKLEKLLASQAALAKQIDDERKAEARAKKEATASLIASKKAHFLRAAERAGLFDFDAALLAQEFKNISERMRASQPNASAENTAQASPTFEAGE